MASVREALQRPWCVQAEFGPADERLAKTWFQAGVSVEDIRRAIVLGSARKSTSLINWKSSAPIVSLGYFEKLLQEVRDNDYPEDYWQYVEGHLEKCEEYWRKNPDHAPVAARQDLSRSESAGNSTAPHNTDRASAGAASLTTGTRHID